MSWVQKLKAQEHSYEHQSNRALDDHINHFKQRLLNEANLETITSMPPDKRKETIENLVLQMVSEEKIILKKSELKQIVDFIIHESVGYGPLEKLLDDDSITEIMVNGPTEIYIERNGKISKADIRFRDQKHIRHIIDRIIAPLGRRIDESSPMADARLHDGSRVNAVLPPISLDSPSMTIRKFKKDPFIMDDLITLGTLNRDMGEFLDAAIRSKSNILVSGGTGSGKTTLLNVLSEFIPVGERLVTIEDMAELRFDYDNIVRLEARPENVEGTGGITIRQLVKNALRMRPDRIIVGEVRSSEAFDMLQAMNTGHEGSLTTVHANSPKDAIGRLEAMVIMSGLQLTPEVISKYFIGAIDLIVQISRLVDGRRKITKISELVNENGYLQVNDIFVFDQTGTDQNGYVEGTFKATGYVPKINDRFRRFGYDPLQRKG
ncbi:CpaF family protein [Aquisalibacillus elongatus]|uniref:Pilus assembly protein CpaF n=1 Tax=Aquisalibacillus elongatus TaxID=485577 RepID=A0A3N5AYR7_9BACI|nr:CpaF family protein [Aquisalibacillus elongatus]RPF50073.1 pilus assembly protein CpaF [Aquisalibacillus elongatus]